MGNSRLGDNRDTPHLVVYARALDGSIPSREFLSGLPEKIQQRFADVLTTVAEAPPHKYSGGGYWERMRHPLNDIYEVRIDERNSRKHHRLFCMLDYERNIDGMPYLVILCGMTKKLEMVFKDREYARVLRIRQEYLDSMPRRIA